MSCGSKLPPVADKHIFTIVECTAIQIHTYAVHTVIVQIITFETCLLVDKYTVATCTGFHLITVVKKCIAGKCHRITLHHLHVAIRIE